MIKEEIEGHIDDQKLDFMSQGMTEQEAEEAAVREMGDPVEVGVELDRIHRPKYDFRLLGFIIGLNTLGIVVQIFILKIAQLCSPGGGMSEQFTLGSVMQHMGAWFVLGVAAMISVCFFDYTLIGKYALWIWAAVMLLSVESTHTIGGRIWLHSVNGKLIIGLMIPVYAAVVYHYRGKGSVGLRKCIALFFFTVMCFGLCGSGIWYQGIFYIAGGCAIAAAAIKGWFGENLRRILLETVICLIGIPIGAAVLFTATGQSLLAPYQQARLESIVDPDSRETNAWFGYLSDMMSKASQEIKAGDREKGNLVLSEEVTESSDIWLSNARSDYVWLFIFKVIGTWQGAVITGLVFAFLLWLFVVVRRQKNYLGFIMGLSCAIMLLMETMLYLAFNFNLLPGGAVYMPFFTYGGINMLLTHLYMGLFLSISRNENLVPVR